MGSQPASSVPCGEKDPPRSISSDPESAITYPELPWFDEDRPKCTGRGSVNNENHWSRRFSSTFKIGLRDPNGDAQRQWCLILTDPPTGAGCRSHANPCHGPQGTAAKSFVPSRRGCGCSACEPIGRASQKQRLTGARLRRCRLPAYSGRPIRGNIRFL